MGQDYLNYTDTPPEVRVSRWAAVDDVPALMQRWNALEKN